MEELRLLSICSPPSRESGSPLKAPIHVTVVNSVSLTLCTIIGASVSEPHIDEFNVNFLYFYISIFLYFYISIYISYVVP